MNYNITILCLAMITLLLSIAEFFLGNYPI